MPTTFRFPKIIRLTIVVAFVCMGMQANGQNSFSMRFPFVDRIWDHENKIEEECFLVLKPSTIDSMEWIPGFLSDLRRGNNCLLIASNPTLIQARFDQVEGMLDTVRFMRNKPEKIDTTGRWELYYMETYYYDNPCCRPSSIEHKKYAVSTYNNSFTIEEIEGLSKRLTGVRGAVLWRKHRLCERWK